MRSASALNSSRACHRPSVLAASRRLILYPPLAMDRGRSRRRKHARRECRHLRRDFANHLYRKWTFTMQAELNGHAVGIILKELVRRAMTVIRNERQVFEATAKQDRWAVWMTCSRQRIPRPKKFTLSRCASVFPITPLSRRKATSRRSSRGRSGPGPSSLLTHSMARRRSFGDNPLVWEQWWRWSNK